MTIRVCPIGRCPDNVVVYTSYQARAPSLENMFNKLNLCNDEQNLKF